MRAKIGQLVKLRAGGPILSITYENLLDDGSYSYYCQWFEYETLRCATFPLVALEPVEGEFDNFVKESNQPVENMEFDDAETECKKDEDYH